jgi:hypothetical protein
VAGVIEKVWLAPEFTLTGVAGEIVPFAPAVGVIVKVEAEENVAEMVWLAVTPENV